MNIPSARDNAATWKDIEGNLWMFGGSGVSGSGEWGSLNDLWKFDVAIQNWVWMGGSNQANQMGIFSSVGSPTPSNIPGGRDNPITWQVGNVLYMYGGNGYTSSDAGTLADLWEYDVDSGMWTFLDGNDVLYQPRIISSFQEYNGTNTPGRRLGGSAWTDGSNLYLLGGGIGNNIFFADLWSYSLQSGQWAWISGDTTANCTAVYNAVGISNSANHPGAKFSSAAFYKDNELWCHGGYGYTNSELWYTSDLWMYSLSTSQWTYFGGGTTCCQLGVYGVQNVPANQNHPGCKEGATSWVDANGNFWLHGGWGYVSTADPGTSGDLWKLRFCDESLSNQVVWNEPDSLFCPGEPQKISLKVGCGNNGIYALGDIGPGGGVVFYDKGYYSNGWRYMEYFPMTLNVSQPWGCMGNFIGNTGAQIGDGLLNTQWVNSNCLQSSANLCSEIVLGGYSDWILPSFNELIEIYNSGTYTGPSINFWSSSEFDANNAYYLNLPNGPEFETNVFSKDANWFSTLAVRYIGQECVNNEQIVQLSAQNWQYVTSYNGHHYFKWPSLLSWSSARVLCEQSGGYLICVNSDGERKNVGDMLATNTEFGDFWLGLFQDTLALDYSEPSGSWHWIDGSAVVYSNWAVDQPSDQWSAYNYGMFDYNNGPSWMTQTPDYLGSVIMEIPAEQMIQSAIGDDGPSVWIDGNSNSNVEFLISSENSTCSYNLVPQFLTPEQIYHVIEINSGDTLLINNTTITTAGYYTFEFGCDSVVTYQVNANYNFDCQLTISDSSICEGEIISANMAVNFSNNPYPVGSIGPAGGFIIYDKGDDIGGWRYVEIAPEDILGTVSWGCANSVVSGFGGLGDGAEIAEVISGNCSNPIALNTCLNYSLNGYDDWYLPSYTELNYAYIWTLATGFSNGNFNSSEYYWTSLEYFANPEGQVFAYRFVDASQGGPVSAIFKNDQAIVRPVRYFSLANYEWSSLDSLQSVYTAPTQSGNLTCTVTLSNGQSCQESQIISVSNLGNLNIEIIPMQNITCSAYDSLGFYVHSLQGNAELDYTWMLLGQEIQTSTDTVLWILPNSSNAYYSSFDNSYLTVSASSASVSCLAMDSLLLSIDTPISWDMIVSTISDWNILPGGEVQMEISIDTSIYFGNDYTFNWTVNDQVISNIQDTIFTFTGLQNNDVIACQLVSINSCQDIYSNVHEIFVDEPMTCTIVPTDTIPCGADSAVLKVNLINSGIPINDWYCTRDTISVSNSITSVISAPQDIEFLRLNMEHSFYSDLEINLICPNGQNISVATNTGPYKFLGEPIDDELFNEGIGWDYFWSSTATNGTLADVASTIPALSSLPSDFYSIQGSWDSILGCPINGDWIIEICDVANFDQGFLFDWEIRFDSTNSSVQVEDVLQYSWNNGQTSEATSFLVNVSDIPNCSVVVFGDSCSSNFDLSTLIPESYFADLDLDGFGDPATSILACNFVPGLAVNALDCNDSVGDINPDGIEICENSIDEDCSGTDLSCVIVGCMDAMACNYNVMATAPDSSCIVVGQTCDDGDIWTLNDTINSQCNCVGYLGTFCEVFPIQIVLDSVIHNTCFAASQGEIFTSVSGGAGLYYASWNTNPIQTMPHAFNLSAGEYTLVITDTAGCTAQLVVPIQEPNGSYPIISGPIDVSGGENAQYSVEGCVNCQYVWSVSYGLVISNPSPQILNVLWLDAEYGTVTVTQIDSMGCEVQTQLTVSINAMVVNEIQNSNSFILFPNPSRDGRINLLKSEGLGGMEHIEIFDLLGNSIFKTDVVINTNLLELSVESLSSGVYLLSIGNDRMRFVVGK